MDHVENYRLPKHLQAEDAEEVDRSKPGHAYHGQELASNYNISKGQDLFAKPEEPSLHHDAEQRNEERRRLREEKLDRKRHREEKRYKREEGKKERKSRKSRKRSKSHKSERRSASPESTG